MPLFQAAEIKASATETSTGWTTSNLTQGVHLCLFVEVTAGSGGSMTVEIEWSYDGMTWFESEDVSTFSVIAGPKKMAKGFKVLASHYRVK